MNSSRNILLTLWLLVFSSASQIMIIGPLLPRIGEELGVETSHLGTLMTAYAVALALFALLTAALVWRYLPEPVREAPAAPHPCATLRSQDALCGPCPEAGHMPRELQDACARQAASRRADFPGD